MLPLGEGTAVPATPPAPSWENRLEMHESMPDAVGTSGAGLFASFVVVDELVVVVVEELVDESPHPPATTAIAAMLANAALVRPTPLIAFRP